MKKIRGYKRRLRQLESWRLSNINLDMEYLKENQRDYVKFRIYPWNPVALSISRVPQLKGEIRKRMIESLIDIFDSWKVKLEESGEPFYLKIWLFEPDISNSQVVCAIGDYLHSYDQTFYKPELEKVFHPENYGKISKRLNEYDWNFHINEYALFESDFQEKEEFLPERLWFENEIKKPHRIEQVKRHGHNDKMYMIKTSDVWVGGKNSDTFSK